ncbi:Unknown protein sequence [Pseudomonas amygdali pv. lachrymans]|nr:Unknown protein sequence [Pseudomonas amygdali pv. lachrymans]
MSQNAFLGHRNTVVAAFVFRQVLVGHGTDHSVCIEISEFMQKT